MGLFQDVCVLGAGGHTLGNTVFEVIFGDEKGSRIDDLVHNKSELLNAWELHFNHESEKSIKTIERYNRHLYATGLPFAAAHFPELSWGRLIKGPSGSGLVYQQILI